MKIKETRRMGMNELRQLCIDNNWCDLFYEEEYRKFLRMSGYRKNNITTKQLFEMATKIRLYTSHIDEHVEITDIMFELAAICNTTFEIEVDEQ